MDKECRENLEKLSSELEELIYILDGRTYVMDWEWGLRGSDPAIRPGQERWVKHMR